MGLRFLTRRGSPLWRILQNCNARRALLRPLPNLATLARIDWRDLTKIGSRPLPPRCRLPTRSPQLEATAERRQRWAWRRRCMAARRLTTIAHALSMLPPAPRVVGSSRRSSGTLRAGADQGAGAEHQQGVVRQVGDASVAGLCHGWDRSSRCNNEACRSQKYRHAPFAANFDTPMITFGGGTSPNSQLSKSSELQAHKF